MMNIGIDMIEVQRFRCLKGATSSLTRPLPIRPANLMEEPSERLCKLTEGTRRLSVRGPINCDCCGGSVTHFPLKPGHLSMSQSTCV